jgi:protease-4
MKNNFWGSFLGALTGTVVAGIISSIIVIIGLAVIIDTALSSAESSKEVEIKDKTVLKLTLDYPVNDRTDDNPFSNFDFGNMEPKKTLGLDEILACIHYAREDKHISGIYLRLTYLPSGMAALEEIRNALIDFKTSGKFVVCYSDYLTQKAYYLASVADQIYLNPAGFMEFKGLASELIFFKKTLEKLGLEPEVIRPTGNKFKSAVEPFINEKSSDANRLQLQVILSSLWQKILDDIHGTTRISHDSLNAFASGYVISLAEDALKHKLVSALTYEDEFIDSLKGKAGVELSQDLNLVTIEKYAGKVERFINHKSKDKIAVIYASGDIVDGKGGSNEVGGETFVKAIRDARDDEKVKAIVLRVNSPGGSAMASELMWRELELAKKKKPLVVSMGDYAASGGYYISCNADTIVANHTTITGSIGVFSILFNTQKLFNEHLGITTDTVKTHRYADFPNLTRPFTAEEKNIMQRQVDHVYTLFLKRVADGRNMTIAQVDSIAQGRVWTGADALRLGLVDVLGGLKDAIRIAAGMANLDSYQIVAFPEDTNPFTQFFKELGGTLTRHVMKAGLKDSYRYYEHIHRATRLQGIQTRMPFTMDIY